MDQTAINKMNRVNNRKAKKKSCVIEMRDKKADK
jgi:hypothetical protein